MIIEQEDEVDFPIQEEEEWKECIMHIEGKQHSSDGVLNDNRPLNI